MEIRTGEVEERLRLPTTLHSCFARFGTVIVCLCAHVYLFIESPLDSVSIQFFTVVGIKVMPLAVSPKTFPNLNINPLNPELNPICYLLALLGAHHFLHFSRIRVKSLTLR